MTFQQDIFKEIQDLLYQLKPQRFTYFFKTNFIIQLYWLFSFTELANPDNEKQKMTGHFRQKSGLVKSQFLFYSTIVSKIF